MGKKGKKAQAGKPKKLTSKDVGKRLNALAKNLEEELEGADLFAPLPPTEDCAICLVPLSRLNSEVLYKACCGKEICLACYMENEASIKKQNEEENGGKKVVFTCAFCREPEPARDDGGREYLHQIQSRCLKNDPIAFAHMGEIYQGGARETPKDNLKALDCWIKAVELGSPHACTYIGINYDEGNGVAVDKKRAALFARTGALRGEIVARHNIGISEYKSANHEIGIRHWKISAEAGHQPSLDVLRDIYNDKEPGNEFISKEYLDSAYRSGHEAQMEIKSEEREKHSGTNALKGRSR